MPTFTYGIPSFDRPIAARAPESGTRYGTRLSIRVGHRSERSAHCSKGVAHRYAFVGMQSVSLEHHETDVGMDFELRAHRSLFLEHGDVFVAMSNAIGAIRYERPTDAPRRPRALPRACRASHRAARATVRLRRDASPVPRDVPPTLRDASPVPRDVPSTPRDASAVPRDTPPIRRDFLATPRDAARVRRASPPMASDALPAIDDASAEPRTCRPSVDHAAAEPRTCRPSRLRVFLCSPPFSGRELAKTSSHPEMGAEMPVRSIMGPLSRQFRRMMGPPVSQDDGATGKGGMT